MSDPVVQLSKPKPRPTDAEVEAAIKTVLRFIGDDPDREGLVETPARVRRSYAELFAGYSEDPKKHLEKCFEDVAKYDSMVVLRDVRFESYCEHHMVPIIGTAHIGYLPNGKVVGISKLARVLVGYAKRLQIQEKLTQQVADAIQDVLQPKGVAVVLEAEHSCMSTRGVYKPGVGMITSTMLGYFKESPAARDEFLSLIGKR